MSDITLYDTPGSPCARRVRIVLLEKGLAWTTRVLDLTKLEQKRPEEALEQASAALRLVPGHLGARVLQQRAQEASRGG